MSVSPAEAANEVLKRRQARLGLLSFTGYTMPTYLVNWHHQLICSKLDAWAKGEIKRLMLFTPPRHGKALAVNTPIPTPSGWTTMGAIRAGDTVFGADGKPCRVVAVSEVWKDRPVWSVTTDTGCTVVADASHLWRVRLDRKHKAWSVRTTEYLAGRTSPRNPLVKAQGALQLPELHLPIEPYVLGVWLGDGCTNHATVTQGEGDIEWLRAEIERCGYETSDRSTAHTFGILGLQKQLREYGLLGDKSIPAEYLRASERQRRALLQGLIDTDGHVAPDGQVEFCSVSEVLAGGVRELVHSLGVKASLLMVTRPVNGVDCGTKYRVMFYMSGAARMPRKAERCKDGTRTSGHYLTLKPAGTADTVCIQVDRPDGMFLCGEGMVPTHNSELASRRLPALMFGQNPSINVISCSYSADLAGRMSMDTQRVMCSASYRRLFPNVRLGEARSGWQRSRELFEVIDGGSYRAAGVGGGITGMGFHRGIIDDPVKDAEEANSPTIRQNVWDWYTSTFWTRQAPDAGILLIMTRWHVDDLAGRLLKLAEEDADADQWEVVNLEAVKTERSNTLGDPRLPTQSLWEARYGRDFLKQARSTLGTAQFEALYQGSPTQEGGNWFKEAWFTPKWSLGGVHGDSGESYVLRWPDGRSNLYYWDNLNRFVIIDPAASEKQAADYTAMGVFATTPTNELLVLDVVRERLSLDRILPRLKELNLKWRPHWIGMEANGFQVALSNEAKHMQGMPAVLELSHRGKGKVVRATPAVIKAEGGGILLPADKCEWKKKFLEELVQFTGDGDKHDDQVDVLAYAVIGMNLYSGGAVSVTPKGTTGRRY